MSKLLRDLSLKDNAFKKLFTKILLPQILEVIF